ncbi:Coenzyme F420 hydrogenase/dehydrogenase, beta subunit C-terminal domain [Algoriphagus sp.]|uniref:Coenzyme F420 hydrogenase/dehydrogenase, beta subunit C-terminal domain n=1 Tax=Algoriphagus sp. TaxID=1872435 RepID=UPI003F711670
MKKTASIEDIVKSNLCTGCGACISESKGNAKMVWDEYGFLIPDGNEFTSEAIKLCPFNPYPEDEVKDEDVLGIEFLGDSSKYSDKIGLFENTYVGYSKLYRPSSSSGGIATYIFEQLMVQNIVNYLFIVKEVNGSYQYQLFDNVDRITEISKTRYIPVSLDAFFKMIESLDGKIAVSGVACFIKSIRLKQHYNPTLKEKIPFLIGIICGGLKSRFYSDFLSQTAGIDGPFNKQEYRIKDANSNASDYSYGAFDKKSKFHVVKMKKVGDMWGTGLFKSNACDFCTDVLTELADISLGDAWLHDYRPDGLGNSVIVTRNKLADRLVQEGILNNSLHVSLIEPERVIESQASSFLHRQDATKFRIRLFKMLSRQTPYIRRRVLKNISFPYAMVQIQRLRVRHKSLTYWKRIRHAIKFNSAMKTELFILKIFTVINQRLRK